MGFVGITLAGAAALAAPAVHAQEQEVPTLPTGVPPAGISDIEPIVAHVHDAAAGQAALLVGTRELVYRDPVLVARLVQAARRAAEAEG